MVCVRCVQHGVARSSLSAPAELHSIPRHEPHIDVDPGVPARRERAGAAARLKSSGAFADRCVAHRPVGLGATRRVGRSIRSFRGCARLARGNVFTGAFLRTRQPVACCGCRACGSVWAAHARIAWATFSVRYPYRPENCEQGSRLSNCVVHVHPWVVVRPRNAGMSTTRQGGCPAEHTHVIEWKRLRAPGAIDAAAPHLQLLNRYFRLYRNAGHSAVRRPRIAVRTVQHCG
jgi:hypothetical protein